MNHPNLLWLEHSVELWFVFREMQRQISEELDLQSQAKYAFNSAIYAKLKEWAAMTQKPVIINSLEGIPADPDDLVVNMEVRLVDQVFQGAAGEVVGVYYLHKDAK